MAIDTKLIMKLRDMTGAGLSDVKGALDESGGDVDKAVEILRKKGAMKAAKKSSERTAEQGLIEAYVHSNGRSGAIVEIRCETDFVARNEDFKNLAHDIAMQIVASGALYLIPQDVPASVIEKEKEIYRQQLKDEGKPEQMLEKILQGKLEKFYQEVCLLNQPFIKDDSISIKELIDQNIAKIGEKIEIVNFFRLTF